MLKTKKIKNTLTTISILIFVAILPLGADARSSNPPKGVDKAAKWHRKGQVWVRDQSHERKVWYKNGNLRAKGEMLSGRRNGDWQFFYQNGATEAKGHYKAGLKTGYWNWYDSNGKLRSQGEYVQNQKQGKWQFYHANGQVKMEGLYKAGMREGEWLNYYSTGKLFYKGHFKNNAQSGEWIYYFKDGSLYQKGQMLRGVRYGNWRICIQPSGPCDTENIYHSRAPRISQMKRAGIDKPAAQSTKNPAELLENLDRGDVPDKTPSGLEKSNPWGRR